MIQPSAPPAHSASPSIPLVSTPLNPPDHGIHVRSTWTRRIPPPYPAVAARFNCHHCLYSDSHLPHPRFTPLKPGSSKESSFIDYVDRKLLGISRRYEKRYNADFEDEATSGIEGRGYESFAELAKDLEGVIDVVWVSGTRETYPTWPLS